MRAALYVLVSLVQILFMVSVLILRPFIDVDRVLGVVIRGVVAPLDWGYALWLRAHRK